MSVSVTFGPSIPAPLLHYLEGKLKPIKVEFEKELDGCLEVLAKLKSQIGITGALKIAWNNFSTITQGLWEGSATRLAKDVNLAYTNVNALVTKLKTLEDTFVHGGWTMSNVSQKLSELRSEITKTVQDCKSVIERAFALAPKMALWSDAGISKITSLLGCNLLTHSVAPAGPAPALAAPGMTMSAKINTAAATVNNAHMLAGTASMLAGALTGGLL
jgi:hypothetical protein